MSGSVSYVVVGAKMQCCSGTIKGIGIGLPIGHGSFAMGKAVMVETDNVVGANIGSFGLCLATGLPCCPAILGPWLQCKYDTLVNGVPALLKTSVLLCGKGGVITFMTDGQII